MRKIGLAFFLAQAMLGAEASMFGNRSQPKITKGSAFPKQPEIEPVNFDGVFLKHIHVPKTERRKEPKRKSYSKKLFAYAKNAGVI